MYISILVGDIKLQSVYVNLPILIRWITRSFFGQTQWVAGRKSPLDFPRYHHWTRRSAPSLRLSWLPNRLVSAMPRQPCMRLLVVLCGIFVDILWSCWFSLVTISVGWPSWVAWRTKKYPFLLGKKKPPHSAAGELLGHQLTKASVSLVWKSIQLRLEIYNGSMPLQAVVRRVFWTHQNKCIALSWHVYRCL